MADGFVSGSIGNAAWSRGQGQGAAQVFTGTDEPFKYMERAQIRNMKYARDTMLANDKLFAQMKMDGKIRSIDYPVIMDTYRQIKNLVMSNPNLLRQPYRYPEASKQLNALQEKMGMQTAKSLELKKMSSDIQSDWASPTKRNLMVDTTPEVLSSIDGTTVDKFIENPALSDKRQFLYKPEQFNFKEYDGYIMKDLAKPTTSTTGKRMYDTEHHLYREESKISFANSYPAVLAKINDTYNANLYGIQRHYSAMNQLTPVQDKAMLAMQVQPHKALFQQVYPQFRDDLADDKSFALASSFARLDLKDRTEWSSGKGYARTNAELADLYRRNLSFKKEMEKDPNEGLVDSYVTSLSKIKVNEIASSDLLTANQKLSASIEGYIMPILPRGKVQREWDGTEFVDAPSKYANVITGIRYVNKAIPKNEQEMLVDYAVNNQAFGGYSKQAVQNAVNRGSNVAIVPVRMAAQKKGDKEVQYVLLLTDTPENIRRANASLKTLLYGGGKSVTSKIEGSNTPSEEAGEIMGGIELEK